MDNQRPLSWTWPSPLLVLLPRTHIHTWVTPWSTLHLDHPLQVHLPHHFRTRQGAPRGLVLGSLKHLKKSFLSVSLSLMAVIFSIPWLSWAFYLFRFGGSCSAVRNEESDRDWGKTSLKVMPRSYSSFFSHGPSRRPSWYLTLELVDYYSRIQHKALMLLIHINIFPKVHRNKQCGREKSLQDMVSKICFLVIFLYV